MNTAKKIKDTSRIDPLEPTVSPSGITAQMLAATIMPPNVIHKTERSPRWTRMTATILLGLRAVYALPAKLPSAEEAVAQAQPMPGWVVRGEMVRQVPPANSRRDRAVLNPLPAT